MVGEKHGNMICFVTESQFHNGVVANRRAPREKMGQNILNHCKRHNKMYNQNMKK